MSKAIDFSGQQVLVVGGSSGIGNAIAQAFRGCGAKVAVWGTRPAASSYAGVEGSDLTGLDYSAVDIANFEAIKNHQPSFDRLDVLVLSQGTVLYRREEFRIEGFRRVIDVNLNSVMAVAERFHPMLVASRGNIVIISSVAAVRATMGNPAYNASKTGTLGLTRTLGQAWAREGIRVNAIAPGLVDTKLTKVTTGNAQRLQGALASIPLGRLGLPEEMADAALFLASPMAAYMTGQMLVVDGGQSL